MSLQQCRFKPLGGEGSQSEVQSQEHVLAEVWQQVLLRNYNLMIQFGTEMRLSLLFFLSLVAECWSPAGWMTETDGGRNSKVSKCLEKYLNRPSLHVLAKEEHGDVYF